MFLLPQRTEIKTRRVIETTESSRTGAENVMDMAIGQRESIIHVRIAPAVTTEIKRELGAETDMRTTAETTITKEAGRGIGSGTGDTSPCTALQTAIIESWAGAVHAKTVVIGGTTMESRAAIEQSPPLHVLPAPRPGTGPENSSCQAKTARLRSAGPRNTKNLRRKIKISTGK